MATNAKYKVKNGGVWEQIHFETTPSQVIGLLSGGKIDTSLLPQIPESNLPDYLFTGTGFIETYSESGSTGTLSAILGKMDSKKPVGAPDTWYEGKYVILSKNLTISPGTYSGKTLEFVAGTYDDSSTPSSNVIAVEAGDFIFCNSYGASVVKFGIVNNTYRDATSSQQGVVTLSSVGTYGSLGTNNKVITEGVLQELVFPVSAGGTGKATLTAKRLLMGNGTGAISEVGAGSDGQILRMDGGSPTWGPEIVNTYKIETGTTDGTIKYNVNDGTYTDVKVKGINTAAYRADSYFATAVHGHGTMKSNGEFDKEIIIEPNASSGGARVKLKYGSLATVTDNIEYVLPTYSGQMLVKTDSKAAGAFYTTADATNPSNSNRLNYDGTLHAKDFVFYRGSTAHNPNVVIVVDSEDAPAASFYKDGDVWIETLGN